MDRAVQAAAKAIVARDQGWSVTEYLPRVQTMSPLDRPGQGAAELPVWSL